jgi:glucosamine--fructose-6-phosphate aminotransferase (isomerizing)
MAAALPTLMARETAEAPAVVAGQLAANARLCAELGERLRRRPPRLVVTCARGSSDHAATYAKYLIETATGLPVASAAPSIASVYQRPLALAETLYLAISQSGRSPDLLASAEQARAGGALVVALVNDAASPLAGAAELCLPLQAGPEQSVAATKSFIAAQAALAQLVASWTEDDALRAALARLPAWLDAALAADWSAATEPLAAADDVLAVGRGIGLAAAQEAALKLKETAALHAEAFSGAELRHGPLAILRPDLPVLMFVQDDAAKPGLLELIQDLAFAGAQVLAAGADPALPRRLPVPAEVPPTLAPLAMIQSFYGLANQVALLRGHDPDRPRHLSKVTETR